MFLLQLSLQLVVNTIFDNAEAVYISTKRNFCPQRVIQMIDRRLAVTKISALKAKTSRAMGSKFFRQQMTRESALKMIHHKLVLSSEELTSTIHQLEDFLESNENVRFIQ